MDYVISFPINGAHHIFSQSTSVHFSLKVLSYGPHSEKAASCPGWAVPLGQVISPECPQSSLYGYCNCQCTESEWALHKNFRTHPHVFGAVGCSPLMGVCVCCVCFSLKPGWEPALMTVLGPPFLYKQQLMLRGEPHHAPSPPSALHFCAYLCHHLHKRASVTTLVEAASSPSHGTWAFRWARQLREWFLWYGPHSSFSIRVTRQPPESDNSWRKLSFAQRQAQYPITKPGLVPGVDMPKACCSQRQTGELQSCPRSAGQLWG